MDEHTVTYEEAVAYILEIPKFAKKPAIGHTQELLMRLGSPQDGMKIVHVAGTNGKGSVCAFFTSMLMESGFHTGTFTSPHLMRINERISLDGEPVGDEIFTKAFVRVKSAAEGMEHPSFFEFLFLMAMVIFQEQKAEYAVIEVGMGGRLDATNAIVHPAISVITSISLDHTQILGDTVEKIAREKAGIIKSGIPVVFDGNNADASAVIRKNAGEKNSPCCMVSRDCYETEERTGTQMTVRIKSGPLAGTRLRIPMAAAYQADNGVLALSAFMVLMKGREGALDAALSGIEKTRWAGRMDEVLPGVYFDGAHNPDAVMRLVETASRIPCEGKKLLLFSAVKDKEIRSMAQTLCEAGLFDEIVLTHIDNPRAASLKELEENFTACGKKCVTIEDNREAFRYALNRKAENDRLFCAGSLYLVGRLMEFVVQCPRRQ